MVSEANNGSTSKHHDKAGSPNIMAPCSRLSRGERKWLPESKGPHPKPS
jgi:hypothetical protein